MMLAIAGILAVPALGQTPDAEIPPPPPEAGRYENRFVGAGFYRSPAGPGGVFRTLQVTAPSADSYFTKGGDLEINFVPDGFGSLTPRTLLGASFLPLDGLRVGAFSGGGVSVAFWGEEGLEVDAISVAAVVPLLVEAGYVVTDNMAVHVRGGMNLGVWGIMAAGGEVVNYDRPDELEVMLSASFGRRDGSRVGGFRIEAGRIYNAWTLMIGQGG